MPLLFVCNAGLPHNETTIAEGLKEVGYATAMVGKWHLVSSQHSLWFSLDPLLPPSLSAALS